MIGQSKRLASSLVKKVGIDGNTATADIAYRMSEMTFMFPITPASPMGEAVERWSADNKKNLFGEPLRISQMQSEGGAAGAIHGAAGLGALTTTFTSSQGLLLMLPDLYRMAGDAYPGVFHVAARSIGTLGVSIYGDHSDVMMAKSSAIAMLGSSTPQESADIAAITHSASIASSYPFIHFFDGFRTSHEINSVVPITDDTLREMIDQDALTKYKQTALSPEHPSMRGGIFPIELFWQFAERANKDIAKIGPNIVSAMEKFGKLTGRHYKPYMYTGASNATDVMIAMGAGAQTVGEYIRHVGNDAKLGIVNIHMYRPFDANAFVSAIPKSAKRITVLDKSRDPLASGEPLFVELSAAIKRERPDVTVIGGKYGISSKNFSPTHVDAVVKNMKSHKPKERFNVGIDDDLTHTSLPVGTIIETVPKGTKQCIFWGFGSDGTVGACKDAIKIIVDNTPLYGQGHFEYTAHKSGGITTSYLRFGPEPIVSPYLIQEADYIACHKPSFVQRFDMVDNLKKGGTVVFNAPDDQDINDFLPPRLRRRIAEKEAKVYVIDASRLADKFGLAGRTNTIMQSSFFILSGVLPETEAVELMKGSAKKTYGRKGDAVVQKNIQLIEAAKENLKKINYDAKEWSKLPNDKVQFPEMPDIIKDLLPPMILQKGNEVPVSKTTVRGDFPNGATQFEKRGIAENVPEWDEKKCVQCGLCSTICPHAVIRPFLVKDSEIENAPVQLESTPSKISQSYNEYKFTIQVSAYDCTGCSKCANICPADALHMKKAEPLFEVKQKKFDYVRSLPVRGYDLSTTSIKNTQFRQPLIEFHGACAGCGEAGIIKMVTQLYGDHAYMTFASGCPVVWATSTPSNSFTKTPEGTGPAFSSSLFEDHAEFGFGQFKALEMRRENAYKSVEQLARENQGQLGEQLAQELLANWKKTESRPISLEIVKGVQSGKIKANAQLKTEILRNRDFLSHKVNWIFGGDGWAYDIGYGGLDHILASGEAVKVIVLDTEVYSNTGGQPSKASNRASSTAFAAKGVSRKKKDLALIAQTYRDVYVATTCLDADPKHTLKCINEAASYDGPAIIINYSPCIEQGFVGGLGNAPKHTRELVKAGYIILSRFDPRLAAQGKAPLQLDSKRPDFKLDTPVFKEEVRFSNLSQRLPERAALLRSQLQQDLTDRYENYARIAASYQSSAK